MPSYIIPDYVWFIKTMDWKCKNIVEETEDVARFRQDFFLKSVEDGVIHSRTYFS